ncbi:MAG TPA: hypothetical protein ENN17_11495 [bacterium]|nr:hypothetical protein [bacterium]
MEKILSSLNIKQREAVSASDGPVLILAGAGSGKTRVLTTRIAYLIREKKIKPWNILAMTFTNKAAAEMKARVEDMVGSGTGLWVGTFHSTFAKILRTEALSFGFNPGFGIYDVDDQIRLIKTIMGDLHVPPDQFAPKSIAAVISKNKNSLIVPQQYQQTAGNPFEEAVAQVYPEYQHRLRINQVFDFDDLITVPIRLFHEYPAVLEKYRTRFSYVLVDEYQDTNRAQYELVHLLAYTHRNLCVVGDDDQSIYGWRGADIRNILDFEKDFPDTRTFRLEQNYRSTRNILKAAASVVEKNVGRKGKTLWCDGPEGEKIGLIEAYDDREEAARVVERIQSEIIRHKRAFKDFAVLYRTNAQSRALEDALRRAGMSYVIVGGLRFYERKEVKDVLAYLRVITNPNDTVSLKRIINFPVRGIGDVTLGRIERHALLNGERLFDALGDADAISEMTEKPRKSVLAFYRMIQKYQDLVDKITPNELAHTLVDEIGILNLYKHDATFEDAGRLENIRELLNAIREYAETAEDPSLAGFLEQVALVTDIDTWNDQSNAVTLMTLHTAKGLEFPVVYIPGLEEGLFPVMRSMDSTESVEEERRLFYVGLTRAKEKIYLLWANNRYHYGEYSYRMPSRFIKEVDPSVLDILTPEKYEPKETVRPPSRSRVLTEPDVHPDYESLSQDIPELQKGMQVLHSSFGKGEIIRIEGRGPNRKISVRFSGGRVKKFIAQYAKFEIC